MEYANICQGHIIWEENNSIWKPVQSGIAGYNAYDFMQPWFWTGVRCLLDFVYIETRFHFFLNFPFCQMHVNNISIFRRKLIHSILLNFSFETISVPSFKVRTFFVVMLSPSTFEEKMLRFFQEKCFSHNSVSSSKMTLWWSPSSSLCWHHCPSWWSSSGPHHPSAPSSWSPCLLDNFGMY